MPWRFENALILKNVDFQRTRTVPIDSDGHFTLESILLKVVLRFFEGVDILAEGEKERNERGKSLLGMPLTLCPLF